MILSALNLAEHFDMGSYAHNGTEYLHLWSEIFKLAMADYRPVIDDPEYTDQTKAFGMITKAYADSRVGMISLTSSIPDGRPGSPELYAPDLESHTTHVSIIDKDGNMVSMTNTLGDYFGTFVTVNNRGFLVQNTKTFSLTTPDYKPEPGKKGKSPMAPTLILSPDVTAFAALGTPGSNRIMSTNTLLISDLIDYGMDMQTALNKPRMYQAATGGMVLEPGIPKKVQQELKALGHTMSFYVSLDPYFGGAHAVKYDATTGMLQGAADPRRSGQAIGY